MATKLPTRQLGTTDMNITRVGFGAWATGGGGWSFGWGPQDDNESIAAMARAVGLGVNWIDTAPVAGRSTFGPGMSLRYSICVALDTPMPHGA